ncbi:MAG: glycosyltransferase family 2 protein [Cycloclasticus sp.]|nr:glycosyltransferase family 2 protein [Cycloclasticus sp.]
MSGNVGIVILNWNGWKDTIECLESLSGLEHQNFSVIVVDNDSSDSSKEKILSWALEPTCSLNFCGEKNEADCASLNGTIKSADLIYVQSSRNGGFAAGNNLGIKLALGVGCEYIWLLNNDTVVAPKSLMALEEKFRSVPDIGMCGSILCYYDDRNQVQAVGGVKFNYLTAKGKQMGQGLHIKDKQLAEIADLSPTYIAGASLFMSVDFLHDVGFMEESYFLYYEEIDWAARAFPKWKVATAKSSIVYHKEGGSIGTDSRSKRSSLSQYYLNRNLIRFYILRKPWLLPVAGFRVLREIFKLFLKKEFSLMNVTVHALVDGLLMRSGPR